MSKKILSGLFIGVALALCLTTVVMAIKVDKPVLVRKDSPTRVERSERETHLALKAPAKPMSLHRIPSTIKTQPSLGLLSPQSDTISYHSEDPTYYYDANAWMDVRFTVLADSGFVLKSIYIWSLNDNNMEYNCSLYVSPDTLLETGQHVPNIGRAHWSGEYTPTLPSWEYFQVDLGADSIKFEKGDTFHVTWGEQREKRGWWAVTDGDGTITGRSMYNFEPGRPDTGWGTIDMDLMCKVGGKLYGTWADLWVRSIYNTTDLFFPHEDSSVQFRAEVRNIGRETIETGDYTIRFQLVDTAGTITQLGDAYNEAPLEPGHGQILDAPNLWSPPSGGEYVAYCYLYFCDPSDADPSNDTVGIEQEPFDSVGCDYTEPFDYNYMMVHFVGGAYQSVKFVPHSTPVMIDSISFGCNFERQESTWVHLYIWEADKLGAPGELLWEDSVELYLHPDSVYVFTVPTDIDTVEVFTDAFCVGFLASEVLEPDTQFVRPIYEIGPKTVAPDGPCAGANPRMHPTDYHKFLTGEWMTGNNDWIMDAHVHKITPPDSEVAVVQIQFPTNGNWIRPDTTYTVSAIVKNNGEDTVSFDVVADDGVSWSDTATVSNLAYRQTQSVEFSDPWPPDTGIDYRFTVITQLPGDERPENDTLVGTVIRATHPDTCELALDDGYLDGAVYWLDIESMWGNEFDADECGFDTAIISHVLFYTGTMVGYFGPPYGEGFPDPRPDLFEVSIWQGIPDLPVQLVLDTVAGNVDSSGAIWWIPKPMPKVKRGEPFWVIMKNIPGGGSEAICHDPFLDHADRRWLYADTSGEGDYGWTNPTSTEYGDFIIRPWLDPVGPIYACGDANGDGRITGADGTYIISYIYRGGPAPLGSGDVNLDGRITGADATYIINYIYRGGPPPCNPPLGQGHQDSPQRRR